MFPRGRSRLMGSRGLVRRRLSFIRRNRKRWNRRKRRVSRSMFMKRNSRNNYRKKRKISKNS